MQDEDETKIVRTATLTEFLEDSHTPNKYYSFVEKNAKTFCLISLKLKDLVKVPQLDFIYLFIYFYI